MMEHKLALKDLEIMRLREALKEIEFELNHKWVSNVVNEVLSPPITYDDLMAWHEAQLGEPEPKKIKRWLWTDKDGVITICMYSEKEKESQLQDSYPIKLTWSETEFEVEE